MSPGHCRTEIRIFTGAFDDGGIYSARYSRSAEFTAEAPAGTGKVDVVITGDKGTVKLSFTYKP